jgi:hypothetical protein
MESHRDRDGLAARQDQVRGYRIRWRGSTHLWWKMEQSGDPGWLCFLVPCASDVRTPGQPPNRENSFSVFSL